MRSAHMTSNRKLPLIISAISFLAIIHITEYNRSVIVNKEDYKTEEKSDKVILSWTPFFGDYYFAFGKGNRAFVDHECLHTNCYITDDRLSRPQHKYDAILFHGYEFYQLFFGKPRNRSGRQLYVFMSLESAARNHMEVVNFYNLTMTYRLDSDIPWPYFKVRDKNGTVVAPSLTARWRTFDSNVTGIDVSFAKDKNKMAAWFVSNCKSTNGREYYVKELEKYTSIEVYGKCGTLECRGDICYQMLSDTYFFYLAFENSHCEDYITEKTFTALRSNTIPIIYARVNLTRFLPPHSYLDASVMSPKQLAEEMNRIRTNRTAYLEYFWWKKFYTFEKTMPGDYFPGGTHPFCELCRILNEGASAGRRNVKEWWLGSESRPTCMVTD